MTASHQSVHTFSQIGRLTADLVWSLRVMYISIRTLFGKVGVLIMVALGVFFLRVILWGLIRILKKNYQTDFEITPENYKELKMIQTDLSSKAALLTQLKRINSNNLPFLLRGVFQQIGTIATILNDYNFALRNQLSELDKLDTGDKQFEVVTESALWSMRTQHYEYRF